MTAVLRRQALLGPNAGTWKGVFIRLDSSGVESERFPTRLEVREAGAEIEASLAYLHTGRVATMRFAEPPDEMRITETGHWSLGPDRTGPWPSLCELCAVHGDRRRRVVVRHGADRLESVVFVSEARPGVGEALPMEPLRAVVRPLGAGRVLWELESGVELETQAERLPEQPLLTTLRWRQQPQVALEVRRRFEANGLPSPDPTAL